MSERLLAQVGAGVHEDRGAVAALQVDRGPQPPVSGILGPTGVTAAADHRHTVRRTGAEKRDLQGWMIGLLLLLASTKRIRSSNSTWSSSCRSSAVRLPRVFSSSMAMISMS